MRRGGRVRCPSFARFFLFCAGIAIASCQYGVPVEISYLDAERSPLSHMVDVTNSFGLTVLAQHSFLNGNNMAFSPYGLMGIMVALYEGVDGDSSFQIQRAMQLPWNRNIMRIGFRDIHRTLKTYFVPEEGFLAGLALNNENVTFNENYKKVLRFYGFDLESEQATTSSPNSITSTSASSATTNTLETKGPATVITTSIVENEPTTPKEDSVTTNIMQESTTISTKEASSTFEATTTLYNLLQSTEITTVVSAEATMASSTVIVKSTTSEPISTTLSTTLNTDVEILTDITPITTEQTPVATSSIITEPSTISAESTISNESAISNQSTTSTQSTTPNETTTSTQSTIPNETTTSTQSTIPNETTTSTQSTIPNESTISTQSTTPNESSTSTQSTTPNESTMSTETTISNESTIFTQSTTPNESTITIQSTIPPQTTITTMSQDSEETTTPTSLDTTVTTENIITRTMTTLSSTEPISTVDTTTLMTTSEDLTPSTEIVMSTTENTTDIAKIVSNQTLAAINESSLETLERRKKSIVDFIFTNPPYINDYMVYRSYDIGPDLPNTGFEFLVDGLKNIQVTYMNYNSVLEHAYLPHLEASALKLPLDSDKYYLLIVLPNRRRAGELERLLSRMARESDLSDVYAALRPRRVRALVPSFIVKGHVTLTTDLQKIGIRNVFEPRQSDFTPMTCQVGVYVRSIEQAVSVAIRKYQPDDTIMNRYVTNRRRVYFSATYPFLYFVMDSNINVALMAGKMVDPLNSRIL